MKTHRAPLSLCLWAGLLAAAGALAACRGRGHEQQSPPGAPSAPPVASSAASAVTSASATASASAESASAPPPPAPAGSASAQGAPLATGSAAPVAASAPCNVIRGPIQLPFTGPATLWLPSGARPEEDARVIFNRDGVARAVTLPPRAAPPPKADPKPPGDKSAAPKKPEPPERVTLSEPAERASAPACAMAGGFVYCMASSGAIHRATLTGEGDTVLASGRPGTSIAAALLGGRPLLAFLADRLTTEGAVTLAFGALDTAAPLQLSEDGSGATFVALGPRGEQAVVMYIDARRALTPIHARVLSADTGKLRLGNDAVLFVGEGSESRPIGALALGESGPAFGLLPTFKDVTTFGVAAIRIDESPRDDAPVTWSKLPSGAERTPIAATHGVSPVRVALVRPASSEAKAKRVLELGEVDATGAIKALCVVAESARVADVGVAADRFGTLWLVYTDAEGTWVERRGAPVGAVP